MKRRVVTMFLGAVTAVIALVVSGCTSIRGGCPNSFGPGCNPACVCPAVEKAARAPARSRARKPGSVASGLRDVPTITQQGDTMVGALFLPTGEPSTSFLMVRRQSPVEVSLGEQFTYAILVQNLTTGEVDNIRVVERNSSGLEVIGSQPQGRMGGDGRHGVQPG